MSSTGASNPTTTSSTRPAPPRSGGCRTRALPLPQRGGRHCPLLRQHRLHHRWPRAHHQPPHEAQASALRLRRRPLEIHGGVRRRAGREGGRLLPIPQTPSEVIFHCTTKVRSSHSVAPPSAGWISGEGSCCATTCSTNTPCSATCCCPSR
uniref:Uncharacterized protein n=1 Tax=Oryza nivara TaxID=4536 RepID=A0A0E0GXF7_ORYNI